MVTQKGDSLSAKISQKKQFPLLRWRIFFKKISNGTKQPDQERICPRKILVSSNFQFVPPVNENDFQELKKIV